MIRLLEFIRLKTALAVALLLVMAMLLSWPIQRADAAPPTTHAFLCRPAPAANANGPGRVVSQANATQTVYNLNTDGCALIAAADIGYFLSQGYFYGPSTFVLTQTGMTASTTSSTSTIVLPAYGYILGIILEETAGFSITGGIDIGDSVAAGHFATAVTLGANAIVEVTAGALNRINVPAGVPTADQVLVACHSSCNSGSVNITILYSFF